MLVLSVNYSKLNFKVASCLLWRLQSLTYLLITNSRLPAPCITPISLLRNTIRRWQVHLLICELPLPHNHRCFTWFFCNIFARLLLLLKIATSIMLVRNSCYGICRIIGIWIQVEFCWLVLRMNLCIFKWFKYLSSGLSMLIFVSVGCLNIHPILLCLELLQKFAVVLLLPMILLLVIWFGSIAVDTLSPTIISSLINLAWLLLLHTRIEVFDSDIFLLYMCTLIGWIKNVYCFVYILLLFIFMDLTDI